MFKHEVHSHDTRDNNNIYTYKVTHAFAYKCIRHSLFIFLFFTKLSSSMYYAKLLCMYAKLRIKSHLSTLCCVYLYVLISIFTYTYILKIVP